MMTKLYFSPLYDRLSSVKTSDEKELYITKTCNNEPDDTGSQGLYYVLRKAIDNMTAVI